MQKKAYLVLAGTVLGILFSSVNNAASLSFCWQPILTLTGGIAFSEDAGQSKNFPANATSFSYYHYALHHTSESSTIFGGLIGAEFPLNSPWLLQVGIAYYVPQSFNVKGIVTQGVDAASANQYPYQYTIQNHQLLLENKLFYAIERYHPYVLLGIGPAWNRTKNFAVNIDPPFTTFSNQFPSNTVTSFSYDIGFGMDINITEHLRFGLGYRFTDLGTAKTGKATIDQTITTNVLSQSHFYTQEGLAQITLLY